MVLDVEPHTKAVVHTMAKRRLPDNNGDVSGPRLVTVLVSDHGLEEALVTRRDVIPASALRRKSVTRYLNLSYKLHTCLIE